MSRTDHPRSYGTHRAQHDLRENAKESKRLPVRPNLTLVDALAEHGPDADLIDLPGLKRLGPIEWDRWWARTSGRQSWLDDAYPMEVDLDDEPERLADWERDLLDLPESTVWQTVSGQDHMWAEVVTHGYESPEQFVEESEQDLDAADPQAWLHGDPHDFFQSVGDAWVIEGPSATRPEPVRAGHYVRVYELAREVGIESKDMVRHLRNSGEYVRSHTSSVAVPVAERLRAIADVLVDTYGARKASAADRHDAAMRRLDVLIAEEARNARAKTSRPVLRPGAPRPGNNPFSPAYARSM